MQREELGFPGHIGKAPKSALGIQKKIPEKILSNLRSGIWLKVSQVNFVKD